jgi:acyl-CoA dehydrogenase
MRAIGMAERVMELMLTRASSRNAFGKRLIEHDSTLLDISQARMDIEQSRLLVRHASRMLDLHGAKRAIKEIAMVKVNSRCLNF